MDFTKAFDSVKHMTLVQKLQLLDLPDHVFNWLVDYFEGRGHATRLGDAISLVAGINASIIQGSVVGPPSYVIVASDLHPKHQFSPISPISLHFSGSRTEKTFQLPFAI